MRKSILVFVTLFGLSGGLWWYARPSAEALRPDSITVSGTIEAETVYVSAELGGRILEIGVDEGDEVTSGQILVELDRSDLLAQKAQLEAELAVARADLQLVSAGSRSQDVAVARAMLAQSEVKRDGARSVWQRAEDLVADPIELEARISEAKAKVNEAETNLETARITLKRVEIEAENASHRQSTHEELVQSEAAQRQLEAAQVGAQMAEVALIGARQQVEHLVRLRERPLPLIAEANAAGAFYRQAEAEVLLARANLGVVDANPAPEDVFVARADASEAEEALAAIEVRLAKQTLRAPRNGLITRRLVNPGELALPGAALLQLSDMENVELTAYVPLSFIGMVKVGQKAYINVDAYAGNTFEGIVTFISHRAEFTPRNVLTEEERTGLVFEVKITMANHDHLLKPGMPADAQILLQASSNRAETPVPVTLIAETAITDTSSSHAEKIGGETDQYLLMIPVTGPKESGPPMDGARTSIDGGKKNKGRIGLGETPTPMMAEPTTRVEAEITSWGLNVRGGPGLEYPVITTLVKGDTVPVTEIDPSSGWLLVELSADEITGWISGKPAYVRTRPVLKPD